MDIKGTCENLVDTPKPRWSCTWRPNGRLDLYVEENMKSGWACCWVCKIIFNLSGCSQFGPKLWNTQESMLCFQFHLFTHNTKVTKHYGTVSDFPWPWLLKVKDFFLLSLSVFVCHTNVVVTIIALYYALCVCTMVIDWWVEFEAWGSVLRLCVRVCMRRGKLGTA